jgi:hypothetical protein
MKVIKATPYFNGEVIQVVAESCRGRRYDCIANRHGAIKRTFRQEASPEPDKYEYWIYVPVPPGLRAARA